jgi:hypothetical protein
MLRHCLRASVLEARMFAWDPTIASVLMNGQLTLILRILELHIWVYFYLMYRDKYDFCRQKHIGEQKLLRYKK